jgi:hypothetical protein
MGKDKWRGKLRRGIETSLERLSPFSSVSKETQGNAMKPGVEDKIIVIPPALIAKIQAAAHEEQRPAEEMLREAIERYLRNRRWQRILAYGQQRAREMGLTEDDVPRLIAEYRQEQRQDH